MQAFAAGSTTVLAAVLPGNPVAEAGLMADGHRAGAS
jgi:hypothetical protein